MKKLTSILISLAMVFTLFAAIPAFAETVAPESTGTFNVHADYIDGALKEPWALSNYQKLYLNFEEALDPENLDVTVYGRYIDTKNSATPAANGTTYTYAASSGIKNFTFDIDGDGTNETASSCALYFDYELSEENTRMRIKPVDSSGTLKNWPTSANGYMWNLYVKVNESEYRLNFTTHPTTSNFKLNAYGTTSTSTTIKDGLTDVATDKSFTAYSAVNVFAGRGLRGKFIITENGELLEERFVSATSNKKLVLDPPAGGWKPGSTYNVVLWISTLWNFDEEGNLTTSRDLKNVGEWNFTTVAPVEEPDPEEPEEPEITPTGKFNIPDNATAVAKETEAIYKFDTPVSAANQAKITAKLTYKTLIDKNITLDNPSSGYTKLTWSDDGQYLTVTRVNNAGNTYNDPWTGGTGGFGRTHKIELSYNGEVFDDLIFTVPQAKSISSAKWGGSTNFAEGGTLEDYTARTQYLRITSDYNVYEARGEKINLVIKKNGEVVNAGTDYTADWYNSAANLKVYDITPTTAWDIKSEYEIKLDITAPCYDKDGTVSYKSILGGEKTYAFYTQGYGTVDEPAVTFADGVATITNNTMYPIENAILILVAKNSTTKLFENILVNNAFSLASGNSTTVEFALASGEEFDYFLLDSKLAPIIKEK